MTRLRMSLSFNHISDSFASNIQKSFDVKVIRSENQLEQSTLIDFEEVGIPRADVISPLLFVLIVFSWWWVILVVSRPLDDFFQNCRVDVRQRYHLIIILIHTQILQHGFDGYGAFCYFNINVENFVIISLKFDVCHLE
ncbi:Protein of unknown function [Cotesia congregata]|uniref:Transmembrane protein n=1 Tax=Cotesia congregata TaxID=51543 RepID=A0A8J2MSM6_COTCN|nr:Protein of unknown function [Cotesia congregata]